MHATVTKCAGVAAYLAFVAGLGAVCVNLASRVGTQAVAFAMPHVEAVVVRDTDDPRPLTLVERRQMEAETTVPPSHPEIADETLVPEAPRIPAPVLAAQLDLAEGGDLTWREEPRVARRASQARRSVSSRVPPSRPARVAAADIFGRSFGVMLTASR